MQSVRRLALSIVPLLALTSAVQAKTLVFCSEGDPEGFNPALYTSGTTFDATSRQIFDRLVAFERGTTLVRPALAESWQISDDGLRYTFRLRRDVTFHQTEHFMPTRRMNADDVLFSFNRQRDTTHPYHRVTQGKYKYFASTGLDRLIENIIRIDEHTVEFVLVQPESPFLVNLVMDFASIHSAEYAAAMLAAATPGMVDIHPVGTGPFQLEAYDRGKSIRYRAHPGYWNGRAKLDNLIFSITPDSAQRYRKLEVGDCHVMPYPNPADIIEMRKNPDLRLLEQDGLNVGYLAFNVEKKPFDDRRVRQAVNMAIDRDAIIEQVFGGNGKKAKNPIPPTVWSYNDAVVDYAYNPGRARELLAEAGYANGFETDLWAMPVQRPYNPNAARMAELMREDLAAIGIRATIVTREWRDYLTRATRGEHQMVLLGWTGDNGDPDNFLHVLLGCDAIGSTNRARWCDPEFDELVKRAKRTSDFTERSKLYEQAQLVFKSEAPWVTIAHSLVFVPVRREVIDFRVDPIGGHVFYGVDLRD